MSNGPSWDDFTEHCPGMWLLCVADNIAHEWFGVPTDSGKLLCRWHDGASQRAMWRREILWERHRWAVGVLVGVLAYVTVRRRGKDFPEVRR